MVAQGDFRSIPGSNAWRSSLPSRATSASLPAEGELERVAAFGALRRFGSGALRRRPFAGSPPALGRLFIASAVAGLREPPA